MGIENTAAKGISWLAFFKVASQSFSWLVTIAVARLLLPEDFGLMAMATVITGYAEIFCELGVGAAIIQRPDIKKDDLASIFWFSMLIAVFFALFCFAVAPITARLFKDARLLPLTQSVSVIFIIYGLQIVPLNLLKRDLNFKSVGFMEMASTIISSSSMIILAYCGAGVWTLLVGRIVNGLVKLFMLYRYASWRPHFYFHIKPAISYIRFGILVAISQSFYYMFEKSDQYFAGRAWNSQLVGYYTFAHTLALIPTEKIVALINQVSFSAFSRLLDDKVRFKQFYLNVVAVTSIIVTPLYVGGYLIADEVISLMLGEKWLPSAILFKYLCLAQIPRSINAINNFVHISRGEPKLSLFINAFLTITMSISFYFAVQYGLNAIVIPWLTTFALVCFGWTLFTLKKIDIRIKDYLFQLFHPVAATSLLFITVYFLKKYLFEHINYFNSSIYVISFSIITGGIVYIAYMMLFNRSVIGMLKKMKGA